MDNGNPWLESFERDGYTIIPDIFSSVETDEVALRIQNANFPRSRAGARHLMHYEFISAIAGDARLMAVVRGILGPTALPFRATLFDKSPDANWLITWHQDTALPLRERKEITGWGSWSLKDGVHYAHAPEDALRNILALRLHLDDSTMENGPLRVLPGSHKKGLLSDEEVGNYSRNTSPVDCLVNKGGVIAMRPLLIHASSKSVNDVPRRVLHFEYARALSMADGLELEVV